MSTFKFAKSAKVKLNLFPAIVRNAKGRSMPSMKNKYFLIEMPQDLREEVKVAAIGQKETMKQFIKIAIRHRLMHINSASRERTNSVKQEF